MLGKAFPCAVDRASVSACEDWSYASSNRYGHVT